VVEVRVDQLELGAVVGVAAVLQDVARESRAAVGLEAMEDSSSNQADPMVEEVREEAEVEAEEMEALVNGKSWSLGHQE
jgi:hypothetical protein